VRVGEADRTRVFARRALPVAPLGIRASEGVTVDDEREASQNLVGLPAHLPHV
jgi:hypothetical protein